MTIDTCALCDLSVPKRCIRDGNRAFCCNGCQAVYTILAKAEELAHFESHPVYKEAVKAGLISNPELTAKAEPSCGATQTLHVEIGKMLCASCADLIQLVLMRKEGVCRCVVDYATDLAAIEYDPTVVSRDTIEAQVERLGYKLCPIERVTGKVDRSLVIRFGVAAFCALNLMMFAYPIYANLSFVDPAGYVPLFHFLSFVVSLPAFLYSAFPFYKRAWVGLKHGLMSMETLVSMGVVSSFGLSLYHMLGPTGPVYFDSMAMIVALVLLGRLIETKAKFSAKASLLRLFKSLPKRARLKHGDFVPVKEVGVGQEIVVVMGEQIPLDGVVMEGQGLINESVITGEAIPILKRKGDPVVAGSMLTSGNMTLEVSHPEEESTLREIIRLVEGDLEDRKKEPSLTDRLSKRFIPLVLVVSALVALYGQWFYGTYFVERAISVLLIACPCALGIAAPLAESLLIAKLARRGIFVRNRAVLQNLGKEDLIVFDKTGTVTEGKFGVISGLKKLSLTDCQVLKALAERSNHPVSQAIAANIGGPSCMVDDIEEIAGRGMVGSYDGHLVLLGSWLHLQGRGMEPRPCQSHGKTVVFFAIEGERPTPIVLADQLQDGMKKMIQQLGPPTALLSGDNEASTRRIARLCGFSYHLSEHTPLMKREWIVRQKEKGKRVMMVGDGINDAPALTAADIGISVAGASTIAKEVCDVMMPPHEPNLFLSLTHWAKRGRRIAAQNLFWAFSYNTVGIVLAACGALSPLFAALAMVASSLMVVVNTLRV